ncbi:nuclear transport factor 2 family protein [Dickeya chrysanthemi]|uniref:nuclear transport factor 2 family protein n=1 Tax=Dickeya chrysanthemi TaxID=556 RepID=UPI0025A187D0|nr:nuclear transport factor 2 family protein [Dickeya chrysanthemi]WJM85496.1 nuclear transport factor 2 family protein [Dickeya chrysanthemi]
MALTTSGIVLFDPSRPFSAAPSARLVIESVQVRRNDAERSQPPVSHKVPMVLQARDRDLRISARLLSFVDPASAHYRYRIDGYAVTLLALGGCATAPAGAVADVPQSVATAAERLRIAMIDPTPAALNQLVADDLSYGHSGGRVDTKASFISDLLDGKSDFVTIVISDQTIKVVGDDERHDECCRRWRIHWVWDWLGDGSRVGGRTATT